MVKEGSLIHILDTHNYALVFFCPYEKIHKCFKSCSFPSLSLFLVLQGFQKEKEERGLIFYQIRGRRHIMIFLDFKRR